MIALLYAVFLWAHSVPVSGAPIPDVGTLASRKPFIVTWEVRWKPPLEATKHSRRFSTAEDAAAFHVAAPLCAKRPAPCVAWIKSEVVTYSNRIKIASLPKGGAS